MSDLLLDTLPPEAGPLLLWIVATWDTARPLLLVLFTAILVAQLAAVWLVWRWWRAR